MDGAGNVFVAGVGSDNAFKITSGGTITQIIDLSEDGLDNPRGIAGDASGNVYVPGFLSDNAYRIARALGDLISFSNGDGGPFHEPGNWGGGDGTVTVSSGGTLEAPLIDIQVNGQVCGDGIFVDELRNGGEFHPGGCIGTATVDGVFTQTSAGTLFIELNETVVAAGIECDLLSVTGAAALAGTVNINLIQAFDPVVGASATSRKVVRHLAPLLYKEWPGEVHCLSKNPPW